MTAPEPDTLNAPGTEARGESMKERGGVQSIERAFTILEEVASHRDGIRLGELSRKVGLHTSTTFHLVKTMVSLGYVRQLKESKRYRVEVLKADKNSFQLPAVWRNLPVIQTSKENRRI